jgi:hypothetical protein
MPTGAKAANAGLGRMDERSKTLFADAERSAERVVGQIRMATALSLGGVFAVTVVARAHSDDAVLGVQIAAVSTALVAYLALGAISYHVAVPQRFRPWMPWVFATRRPSPPTTHQHLGQVGANGAARVTDILLLPPLAIDRDRLDKSPDRRSGA